MAAVARLSRDRPAFPGRSREPSGTAPPPIPHHTTREPTSAPIHQPSHKLKAGRSLPSRANWATACSRLVLHASAATTFARLSRVGQRGRNRYPGSARLWRVGLRSWTISRESGCARVGPPRVDARQPGPVNSDIAQEDPSAKKEPTHACLVREHRTTGHQHHSHACRWMRYSRPTAAIPAPPWPWRPSRTPCGTSSSSTIPAQPLGRPATASCCPADMRRCCCTRSSIWPESRRWTRRARQSNGWRSRRTSCGDFGSWAAPAPGIRSTAKRPASK